MKQILQRIEKDSLVLLLINIMNEFPIIRNQVINVLNDAVKEAQDAQK
jgi:hypothetical protein